MRTNNLISPLGISIDGKTKLSWGLASADSIKHKNQIQSAYRIVVSSENPAGLLWDTGIVHSTETLQLQYAGKPLAPSQQAQWQVTVWNQNNVTCGASKSATFETALQPGETGWDGAEWIARFPQRPLDVTTCDLYQESEANAAPRFRAEVKVPPTVVTARAYIAGLGYYQLFIDGNKVGTSMLDPGWTTYSRTVLYAVYDVTEHLTTSNDLSHAFGVELGNGWWNPHTLKMWGHVDLRKSLTTLQGRGNHTTTEPMFRFKVIATLSDGSQQTLLTSVPSSWAAAGSPTRFNDIYLGEKYDATLDTVFDGWSSTGYNASAWTAAVLAGSAASLSLGELEPQAVPPIRKLCAQADSCNQMGNLTCDMKTKCPWSDVIPGVLNTSVVSTTSTTVGGNYTVVLDAGKNFAGVCRFRLNGVSLLLRRALVTV